MKVRKGVFPAAGLGTRFLPATKAQPMEMLPLVDKPMIQYVVEEAAASGLSEIIIVTGRGKRAIEDHFDAAFELEYYLSDRGKTDELAQIKTISELASVSYVRQKEPLGLGHAILCARALGSGHHRTVRAAARDFRDPGRDQGGRPGRNPAHRRPADAPGAAPDVCRRVRGPPLRYRGQARLPQGDGGVRPGPARPRQR